MKKLLVTILLIITLATFYHNKHKTHPIFRKNSSKHIVTVDLQGQFGNQLFQTAAAISFALDHDCRFVLPKEYLLTSSLGIKKNCKTILFRLPFKKISLNHINKYDQPPPYQFDKIPFNGDTQLKGFFESEKFFKSHKDLIIELFSPSKPIVQYLKMKYHHFLSKKTVGIHIRTFYRDYLGAGKEFYKHYLPPDLEYIEKAISLFDDDTIFVVCSDYIPWCKKNLKHIPRKFVFIENQKRHLDFYLLTLCDHMITSNSSFSWWAAYLNKNPNKIVIAKDPWYLDHKRDTEDIIPKEWTIIKANSLPPIPEFD